MKIWDVPIYLNTICLLPIADFFTLIYLLKLCILEFVLKLYKLFYLQALEEEEKMTPEQLAIKNVGKQDPKRHLEEKVDTLMASNIVQCLGAMLDTVVFK